VSARPRVGVVLTAPNTVLERDLWGHEGERVSWHSSRVPDNRYDAADAASHASSVTRLTGSVDAAVEAIAAVRPELVVIGLSAAPFKADVAAHRAWKASLEGIAGVPVVTLGDAIEAALAPLGGARVALLTPLHPDANAPIAAYLTELGVTVTGSIGLACADTAAIADVGADELSAAVRGLDGPDVDAIVQVGTNLDFVSVATATAEELGKPVIAANAALAAVALARLGATRA
jgi:maleate isomerase